MDWKETGHFGFKAGVLLIEQILDNFCAFTQNRENKGSRACDGRNSDTIGNWGYGNNLGWKKLELEMKHTGLLISCGPITNRRIS